MESGTPQETASADKPAPAGVAGLIGPDGVLKPVGDGAPQETPEGGRKTVLVVTISVNSDGSRTVDSKSQDGSPVAVGRVREILREAKEHFDDRVMALMVQQEARRVVAEAAGKAKDRNMVARLFHSLR